MTRNGDGSRPYVTTEASIDTETDKRRFVVYEFDTRKKRYTLAPSSIVTGMSWSPRSTSRRLSSKPRVERRGLWNVFLGAELIDHLAARSDAIVTVCD